MSWVRALVDLFKALLGLRRSEVGGSSGQDVTSSGDRAKIYAELIPKGEGEVVSNMGWSGNAMRGKYFWDVKDGKAVLLPQNLSFEIGFVKVLSAGKGWTVKDENFNEAKIPVKVNYRCSLLDGKYVFRGSTIVVSGSVDSIAKIEVRIASETEIPVERDGNQFLAGPLTVDVEAEA